MIGKLKGRVDSADETSLIIDVGGVGYVAFCHTRALAQLEPGTAVELIIETHVREDHIHLYGFLSVGERDWFRMLTTVQGVGAKMGMAILGTFAPDQLHKVLAAQDKKALTAVSGVGPKLAERIVTELKSKVGSLPGSDLPIGKATGKAGIARPSTLEDAVSALVHLGYGRAEAYSALARASGGEELALDALIKAGLKELAA
jgi:Holliday junction DNA helicase RuvA